MQWRASLFFSHLYLISHPWSILIFSRLKLFCCMIIFFYLWLYHVTEQMGGRHSLHNKQNSARKWWNNGCKCSTSSCAGVFHSSSEMQMIFTSSFGRFCRLSLACLLPNALIRGLLCSPKPVLHSFLYPHHKPQKHIEPLIQDEFMFSFVPRLILILFLYACWKLWSSHLFVINGYVMGVFKKRTLYHDRYSWGQKFIYTHSGHECLGNIGLSMIFEVFF